MKIGILTIGNELTSGRTQDTNSSLMARIFSTQGWPVSLMMSVGDDDRLIKQALGYILAQSDAVVITGGLGPTADDITTAAISGPRASRASCNAFRQAGFSRSHPAGSSWNGQRKQ